MNSFRIEGDTSHTGKLRTSKGTKMPALTWKTEESQEKRLAGLCETKGTADTQLDTLQTVSVK